LVTERPFALVEPCFHSPLGKRTANVGDSGLRPNIFKPPLLKISEHHASPHQQGLSAWCNPQWATLSLRFFNCVRRASTA